MARDPHHPLPAHAEPTNPHSATTASGRSSRPAAQAPPPSGTPSPEPPFLPLHTAVVLLTAAFIGTIMGGLMFLTEHSTPKAVLTGLTVTGACTIALRKMIR
ncbi:hypothetical protein GCM10010276_88540 [Streptomyces longisporus]|uniref:Uncharacterized protein n=1 Tax=Streptomyces longisporus TaxID=1948 RepID=A0ABN3NJ31_STRLO